MSNGIGLIGLLSIWMKGANKQTNNNNQVEASRRFALKRKQLQQLARADQQHCARDLASQKDLLHTWLLNDDNVSFTY